MAVDVLRKGAVLRVPESSIAAGVELIALSYVDVRFDDDGHVERWLGPGEGWLVERRNESLTAALTRASDVADEQTDALVEELADYLGHDDRDGFDGAPVEIVVEWNVRTG